MIDYSLFKIPKKERDYALTKGEGEIISNVIRGASARKTIETGFGYGISSCYIIDATRQKHIAIDPYQDYFDRLGIHNIKAQGMIDKLHWIDDFSHNVLPDMARKGTQIDFAFIDGSQRFDTAFVDFFYIDLMLKKNGLILFHDGELNSIKLIASWANTNMGYRLENTFRGMILMKKVKDPINRWGNFKEFCDYDAILGVI